MAPLQGPKGTIALLRKKEVLQQWCCWPVTPSPTRQDLRETPERILVNSVTIRYAHLLTRRASWMLRQEAIGSFSTRCRVLLGERRAWCLAERQPQKRNWSERWWAAVSDTRFYWANRCDNLVSATAGASGFEASEKACRRYLFYGERAVEVPGGDDRPRLQRLDASGP